MKSRLQFCLRTMLIVFCLPLSGCFVPGNSISTNDFKSDHERINFIDDFSPIPIPPTASDVRFDFVEWKGISLAARFVLPQNDFDDFLKAARKSAVDKAETEPADDGTVRFSLQPKPGLKQPGEQIQSELSATPNTRVVVLTVSIDAE